MPFCIEQIERRSRTAAAIGVVASHDMGVGVTLVVCNPGSGLARDGCICRLCLRLSLGFIRSETLYKSQLGLSVKVLEISYFCFSRGGMVVLVSYPDHETMYGDGKREVISSTVRYATTDSFTSRLHVIQTHKYIHGSSSRVEHETGSLWTGDIRICCCCDTKRCGELLVMSQAMLMLRT